MRIPASHDKELLPPLRLCPLKGFILKCTTFHVGSVLVQHVWGQYCAHLDGQCEDTFISQQHFKMKTLLRA